MSFEARCLRVKRQVTGGTRVPTVPAAPLVTMHKNQATFRCVGQVTGVTRLPPVTMPQNQAQFWFLG